MSPALSASIAAFALAFWVHGASAQFSSGSTGTDGSFAPATNQDITVRPGGVYNYTTVNIPAGVTVRYFKNTDNAPVVILATGNVTINGNIVVSGFESSYNGTTPAPGGTGGPGGFPGGTGGIPTVAASAGKGPGGGQAGTPAGDRPLGGVYGAPETFGLIPLFGGSGGGGGGVVGQNQSGPSGGGGGGAILIASSTQITVNGAIRANGGNQVQSVGGGPGCSAQAAAGSGGAIRLVAPVINGGGQNSVLQAIPGLGVGGPCVSPAGPGRIRLEASNLQGFAGFADPTPTFVNVPGPVSANGNPALANVPTLTIASIGGQAVPATPLGSHLVPDVSLPSGTGPVDVVVNATNTPVDAATQIRVRLMPRGTASTVTPAAHTGTFASSTATASVTFPPGQISVVQAWASMTLSGQFAALFPLIDGERVESVVVAANLGEASTLSLVTASGREVPLSELRREDQLRVAQAWASLGQ